MTNPLALYVPIKQDSFTQATAQAAYEGFVSGDKPGQDEVQMVHHVQMELVPNLSGMGIQAIVLISSRDAAMDPQIGLCWKDPSTQRAFAGLAALALNPALPSAAKLNGFENVAAVKRDARFHREKPDMPDRVLALAEGASPFATPRRATQEFADNGEAFGMIGRDYKMQQIVNTIRTAAPSDASVLIEGESGTGKELIATAFHTESDRASGPFIRINCAAIPHELIESELFGYKKGAFTGADRDKRGLIEVANNGTLLLDEIAEMPAHFQTKLLRVLQERKLRRVGDEREIDVSFRLVCATNRDTASLVKEGVLRKDLYFRISTIRVKVPPLRERLDDVVLLAQLFLERYDHQYGKRIQHISQETLVRLTRYDWPGNIRELENVIERAVLFCPGNELTPGCLPEEFQNLPTMASPFVIPPLLAMQEIEREAIVQTLQRTNGNVKKSAQILRFPRPTFYRKLKKFGIKVER
jgi:transcriptional regulator with PAS, ATPase and Fis domain